MGCSASKVAVVPIGDGSDPPPPEDKISSETFIVAPNDPATTDVPTDIAISARTSQGLAFEVPVRGEEENVIKKHPPKRFQRLEDQQLPLLTHQLLDEKQAEAEQRRLQILSQRVQSARSRQKLKRNFISNGESNGFLIESMNQEPTTVEL